MKGENRIDGCGERCAAKAHTQLTSGQRSSLVDSHHYEQLAPPLPSSSENTSKPTMPALILQTNVKVRG